MNINKVTLQDLQEIHNKLDEIQSALLTGKAVLTFEEAGKYTGLSKSYLYKLTSRGQIPHSKPNGKQVYFGKAELDMWLLRNQVKTSAEIEAEAVTYITLQKNRNLSHLKSKKK